MNGAIEERRLLSFWETLELNFKVFSRTFDDRPSIDSSGVRQRASWWKEWSMCQLTSLRWNCAMPGKTGVRDITTVGANTSGPNSFSLLMAFLFAHLQSQHKYKQLSINIDLLPFIISTKYWSQFNYRKKSHDAYKDLFGQINVYIFSFSKIISTIHTSCNITN